MPARLSRRRSVCVDVPTHQTLRTQVLSYGGGVTTPDVPSSGPRAWLIRAGRFGEREAFGLANSVVGGGFSDIPDLTEVTDWDGVVRTLERSYPEAPKGKIRNFGGQVWALRERIAAGDLVVLPMKNEPVLAIGEVTGPYTYLSGNEPGYRHYRPVKWLRVDVPRTAVRQDLLYSLGAFMTVCEVSRNDAAWRVGQLAATGVDPGSRSELDDQSALEAPTEGEADSGSIDLRRVAQDRIQSFVAEQFAGHALAKLVGDILDAEGYVAEVSPPGPDGGIDVFAGSGPLGLDSPRLIVQVKSGSTPVDAPTVRQLHGVLATHGADQALLVAWGGLNTVARRELQNQFFRVRVWDADDLIDATLRNYDKLPDDTRTLLPLQQMWTLVEGD